MTLALLAMNYCLSYRKAVIILNSGNLLKKKVTFMTAIGKVIKSKERLFSSDYGITWNRQKNEN